MMFDIYSPVGEYMQSVECESISSLLQQTSKNAQCFQSAGKEPHLTYVKNNAVLRMPIRPSSLHIFDIDSEQWVLSIDLQGAKAIAWDRVKVSRGLAEYGGFMWDSSQFDSDEKAQQRLTLASQYASLAISQGQPFSIEWTLADNTTRTLNGTDLAGVMAALADHINTQHVYARTLRTRIEAAQTSAEALAITW